MSTTPALDAAQLLTGSLEAVRLAGSIATRHTRNGTSSDLRRSWFHGVVDIAGRFDLEHTFVVSGEGTNGVILRNRYVRDARALAAKFLDNSEGFVYTPDSTEIRHAELLYAAEATETWRWLTAPFRTPLFSTLAFSESDSGPLVVSAQRGHTVEWQAGIGSAGLGVPAWTRVLDASGRAVEHTTYSEYAELAPGVWRPMRWTRLDMPTGDPADLVIETVVVLTAAAVESAPTFDVDSLGTARWTRWL